SSPGRGPRRRWARRRRAVRPWARDRTLRPGRGSSVEAWSLRVIGAGLGRTGTHSLKVALEELLGGPCYHVVEVFGRPDHIDVWQRAIDGEMPDWPAFLSDYRAAVDWPVAAFWRETTEAFPDA